MAVAQKLEAAAHGTCVGTNGEAPAWARDAPQAHEVSSTASGGVHVT